ncbi:MAG: NTP transferase domain-containing protein, partial [Tepidisphaeraceae bacterium]
MAKPIDLSQVTLAILAGGEGRRMGKPKAELRIDGVPILQYLLQSLQWPGPTLLVTAPSRERPPGSDTFDREAVDSTDASRPSDSPSPCTQGEGRGEGSSDRRHRADQTKCDPHPSSPGPLPEYIERGPVSHAQGPLRGIVTAMQHADTELVAIITVDMPAIAREHLHWLIDQLVDHPARLGLMLRRPDNGDSRIEPFPFVCAKRASNLLAAHLPAGHR